ncbi:transglycosylase SLT domain-containing protein, partial [Treponema sp. R6D11]
MQNADEYNVPAALAFALCWEESRFNPRAVGKPNRDGSIDRGLFQLNNRSFPELDTYMFFNVQHNARYGISHLRYCLDYGGSEVSALA